MAEKPVPSTATSMKQTAQREDDLPMVYPGILKDNRVMLVKDLDVDCVLAGLKPLLYYSQYDAIHAETNHGSKTGKLIDVLQRLSVKKYHIFNSFLKIVAGTQPDLFCELIGRSPSDTEADFCVERYVESLKRSIKVQGHSTDSPLDEKIDFDSEHVQLTIARDTLDDDKFHELPQNYQAYLFSIEARGDDVPAAQVLDTSQNEDPPKRVSVYGRAGTGKTTTFQWLAREWSFNRWAPQFTVLFLLQFRMLLNSDRHMTAIELLTLAGLYQVTEAGLVKPLSSWLKHAAGRVLILIDGLDELAGFAARLKNCPIISDLQQTAHPIDLCLNIIQGNLLPGSTVITASRPFTGLSAIQLDKQFEILGLTESRVKEFVERKYPFKAGDVMAVLTNSPLLMSVCSITFYCALISRLLCDGVIFQQEDLQTYTRLMAFLIIQCFSRKFSEWSFVIHVNSYFHKLARMAYSGVYERQLNGEMPKLVFNDYDISRAQLTPQELKSIQDVGLLQRNMIKIGRRQSVIAEFFHLSIQELLASAYLLSQVPDTDIILEQVFSEGQFNMALMYLFGLQFDTGSDWINDIRHSIDSFQEGFSTLINVQIHDFLTKLCEDSKKESSFTSKLQICQLLYEGQIEEQAKGIANYIAPNGKLTIKSSPMTIIDIMAISHVCKHVESLTEISISRCNLTDTLVEFLASSLLTDHAEALHTLNLANTNIGSAGATAVAKWLKQNHMLHNLNVARNKLGDDGVVEIAEALHVNSSLRVLDVSRNSTGLTGAKALSQALFNNSTLQVLDVSSSFVTNPNAARELFQALQVNSTLQTLRLRVSNVCGEGVRALAKALTVNDTLQVLDISIGCLGEEGATTLAKALTDNKGLRSLLISGNQISDNGAKALATALHHNKSLQTLDVSGNGISKNGAQDMADALHHNNALQTLNISCNFIGQSGAVALSRVLHHNTSLLALYVGLNNIGVNGATSLAESLHKNNSIHTLDVSDNRVGEVLASALSKALQHNSSLHTLYMSGCDIGKAGASVLAEALRHNKNLLTLYIGSNNIGWGGAKAVAEALIHNSTLQALICGTNGIGDIGAVALAYALHHNTGLQTLYCEDNKMGKLGADAFAEALLHNVTLQNLYVGSNSLTRRGARALSEVVPQNKQIRIYGID